tara:strand:- start:84 stop:245 length:162 start_codon:yes stop_codon:yes gene_type:complete
MCKADRENAEIKVKVSAIRKTPKDSFRIRKRRKLQKRKKSILTTLLVVFSADL